MEESRYEFEVDLIDLGGMTLGDVDSLPPGALSDALRRLLGDGASVEPLWVAFQDGS